MNKRYSVLGMLKNVVDIITAYSSPNTVAFQDFPEFNIDLQCIANNLLSAQFTKANGIIRFTAAKHDKEGDHSIAVVDGSCS